MSLRVATLELEEHSSDERRPAMTDGATRYLSDVVTGF